MAKRAGKGIQRITSLYAEGTMVYGTVRSQSGISDRCFRIDFNDYGNLTGTYRIPKNIDGSDIPKIVADRIAKQIRDYPEVIDDSFNDELYREEVMEELRVQAKAYCPYCGKQNQNKDAKFCMYCGMRFHI
ncbi:MAG: zinc ribbon domain-containing protein [Clostridiales bacterium]|nr:zinc ribbon domain-containing protein [Clostridiales bacterium]